MNLKYSHYNIYPFKFVLFKMNEPMQVSFSQIKQILKKLSSERSYDDIQILKTFFKDNQFFQKYGKENGDKWLSQIYSAIKYERIKQNDYVIRYGEFGTVYYIIV